jgi:hypothetical protein
LRLQQHHHTKKLKPWRSNPTVEDNEYYILRHWSLRPTMTKSTIYCSNKEECETNAPCPNLLVQETESWVVSPSLNLLLFSRPKL